MDKIKNNGRVGIFGGTFNPLHVGHLNAVNTVKSRLSLEKIFIIPAAQNPRKQPIEGPTDQQRVDMIKIGFEGIDGIEVDTQELERGGLSYTVQTLEAYAKNHAPEDLHLIVGLDQFYEFDRWKDFAKILTLANLVVVTRPGFQVPFSVEDLPSGLQPLIAAFDRQFLQLTTERHVEFVRLQDTDVSANDVRKRLRSGRSVDRYLSIPVEEYIRANGLYSPLKDRIANYEDFTKFCGDILFSKKAIAVRGFDLTKQEAATDFTLVASGTSTRHAASLAEAVTRAVKEEYNIFPLSIEGQSEGRWVLIDYGALIVHVFYDFVRQEYHIEDLWRAARDLQLKDNTAK